MHVKDCRQRLADMLTHAGAWHLLHPPLLDCDFPLSKKNSSSRDANIETCRHVMMLKTPDKGFTNTEIDMFDCMIADMFKN